MNSTVFTSLTVSCIAILVIFIVLIILIYTIKLLVHLIPYEEPPESGETNKAVFQPTATGVTSSIIVAAITAAMAIHLGKSPQEFHITQINTK